MSLVKGTQQAGQDVGSHRRIGSDPQGHTLRHRGSTSLCHGPPGFIRCRDHLLCVGVQFAPFIRQGEVFAPLLQQGQLCCSFQFRHHCRDGGLLAAKFHRSLRVAQESCDCAEHPQLTEGETVKAW